MTVSNEFKVGVLTIVGIALLFLGFNFLKGKSIFDKSTKIYATFSSVEGLNTSSPVTVNGLAVGKVYSIREKDRNISGILVTINLAKDVLLPDNSVASVVSDLLGTTSIKIDKGDVSTYLEDGDTLLTVVKPGMIDNITGKIDPTLKTVNGAVTSLDSLLEVVGQTLDPVSRKHLQSTLANLDATSAELRKLTDSKNGKLASTLSHTEAITANLHHQNDTINQILSNVNTITGNLSELELKQLVTRLEETIGKLDGVLGGIQQGQGTLGKLMKDDRLYNDLISTNYKLRILLDDFRAHPKRYVNVSVFGKKDKSQPLTSPLVDDTTKPATPPSQFP